LVHPHSSVRRAPPPCLAETARKTRVANAHAAVTPASAVPTALLRPTARGSGRPAPAYQRRALTRSVHQAHGANWRALCSTQGRAQARTQRSADTLRTCLVRFFRVRRGRVRTVGRPVVKGTVGGQLHHRVWPFDKVDGNTVSLGS
jgi:hypothetical protein